MLHAPTREVIIDPVHPNAGIAAAYRKRLDALIARMQGDIVVAVKVVYPVAMDASPAILLRNAMRRLSRKWQAKFDALAPELAAHFATAATKRSSDAMAAMLKKAGFTVSFKLTPDIRNILAAEIAENVSLIRSIPSQHFTQIEGHVMRSVAAGRDLHTLTVELHEQHGVTRRRAETIARDQNNKATAGVVRARQHELGITEAVWMHSAGGRKPRLAHVAFSGQRYAVARGAYIEGEFIVPGEKINCRCVSKSVIKGF